MHNLNFCGFNFGPLIYKSSFEKTLHLLVGSEQLMAQREELVKLITDR